MDKYKIESERLMRVAEAMGRGDGDLSDCLAPDVKHVVELLARVAVLQDLAPGFLDEMFELWIPHFIKQHNRAVTQEVTQRKANESGFGAEWAEAVAAGKSPNQKDFVLNMVQVLMRANGVTQAEAIRSVAEHSGREEGDIRRVVTRSKARKKT